MLDYAHGIKKKRERKGKSFSEICTERKEKRWGKERERKGDDKTQNYVESSKPYKYKAPKRDGWLSSLPLKVCEKICNLFSHTQWLFASGGFTDKEANYARGCRGSIPHSQLGTANWILLLEEVWIFLGEIWIFTFLLGGWNSCFESLTQWRRTTENKTIYNGLLV